MGSPHVSLGTLQGLCDLPQAELLVCILGPVAWSPAECGQGVGAHAPLILRVTWLNGAFGAGSELRSVSGSFSSRGALIGFAVAPVTLALVMLAGGQEASATLGTCVSLAPFATEGPLSCLGWDCCRSRVPGEVAAFPMGSGQRVCFCHAWKRADGGEETLF